MHKTEQYTINSNTITADTNGLAEMLSCGRGTAVKIGLAAGARVKIGKRVLWYLPKIHSYLGQMRVV